MKRALLTLLLFGVLVTSATADAKSKQLPPHWRTWVAIGRCEMPVKGVPGYTSGDGRSVWMGIAWNQTRNSTYNGLGLTAQNWETFRRASQKSVDVHEATPIEQLWSAERLWAWANSEYPGNGWTAWECSPMIGWTTSNPTDAIR